MASKNMADEEQFHGAEPLLQLPNAVTYAEEENLGSGLLSISEQ